MSTFACVWRSRTQAPLCAVHMNGAGHTLELYNFLRESPMAGHLFVRASGTKEDIKALGLSSRCAGRGLWPQRGRSGPRVAHGRGAAEPHFHPKTRKVINWQGGCP